MASRQQILIGWNRNLWLGDPSQIFPAGDFQWRWEKHWKCGLLVPLLLVYEVLGVNPRTRQALYQLRDIPGHFCSLVKTPCNSRVWTQPHQHTWLCYIQKRHGLFFFKFDCIYLLICMFTCVQLCMPWFTWRGQNTAWGRFSSSTMLIRELNSCT